MGSGWANAAKLDESVGPPFQIRFGVEGAWMAYVVVVSEVVAC